MSVDSLPARPQPDCRLCGARGVELYRGLHDRLFGAPGRYRMARCPQCRLIWLDPMPVEESIGLAYASYYTHGDVQGSGLRRRYAEAKDAYVRRQLGYPQAGTWLSRTLSRLAVLHPGGYDEMARDALFLRAPRAGARLLEVGCGSGETLAYLRDLGWSVTGVEVDPSAVRVARERGLTVHEGPLQAASFEGGSFDAAVMVHVIEHVHDPVRLLREVRRVLVPGGRVTILTPNSESLGHRRFGAAWVSLDPPRHLHVFNAENLGRAVEMAGLSAIGSRTSVRGARAIAFQGRGIRRAGRWDVAAGLPGPLAHLSGVPFQLGMRTRVAAGQPVGEELILVAAAPAA